MFFGNKLDDPHEREKKIPEIGEAVDKFDNRVQKHFGKTLAGSGKACHGRLYRETVGLVTGSSSAWLTRQCGETELQ